MSKLSKLVKRGGRIFAGGLLCGAMMFGTAAAEEAPALDGMEAFREAITMTTKQNRRVFHQDLLFFAPSLRADLDLIGQTMAHKLRIAGKISLIAIDDRANTTDLAIPFYIDQQQKEMTLYFKPDKKWYKFQTPTLAASAIDELATPDEKEADEILSTVKAVTVLRETDAQRTMLVQLDSEKLADLVSQYSQKYPADKGTADDGDMQKSIMGCLEAGVRRSNIWYTWTIDKASARTVTMSYNLSSVLQETARVALETHPELPPELAQILETIAYYSDLKTYTTFLSPKAVQKLDLPEEAKAAELVEDLTDSDKKPEAAK
ncbi:MAG: hypothetical protein J6N22_04090 [Schwartzia sp.]|nr:hypothetical protein [Schwartzia sp. (in: firmicutes)]